ncbi:MAG: TSUP family transporter [bacterium]
MLNVLLLILLGLVAGILSGLIGIGGGIIIIPAFVFFFGMSQHQAQGTTLALFVPPIGILAAWEYYKHGQIDLTAAALVCLGFVFGGYVGAQFANALSNKVLTRIFGMALLIMGLQMMLRKS